MPELPEVETVARGLIPHLVGRTITGVEVFWEKTAGGAGAADFSARLLGRGITGSGRRGKYILFALDDGSTMVLHLRMTGRLFVVPPGAARAKHLRVAWLLDDGSELHFVDMRKFGRVAVLSPEDVAALDRRNG
jgi:formamidopyrimidine-DNA glycosylase